MAMHSTAMTPENIQVFQMRTGRTISEEEQLSGEPLLRGLSSVFGVYATMA